MKVVAPIALSAVLLASPVGVADASAMVRFDPGLTNVPNGKAALENVWWHRHWYRHYSWHWRRHWHRW